MGIEEENGMNLCEEQSKMFSIIVPVYNAEKYLKQCIESVLKQTYIDFEMILIDDGSTDASAEICDAFALKDQRVIVVHKKNEGAAIARNRGIDIAKGKFFIFLDSDDYWIGIDILESVFRRLLDYESDVITLNFVKQFATTISKPYFDEIENMSLEISNENSFLYMIKHDLWIACPWNKVIKGDLFDSGELRFEEGITAEDIDWCARLALKANRFDYLGKPCVSYRQTSMSVSNTINEKAVLNLCWCIDKCLKLIDNFGEKQKLLMSYISYQYATCLYTFAQLEKNKGYFQTIKYLKEKQYLLQYSQNKKVKLIRISSRLIGLKGVLYLLTIKSKYKK